MKTDVSADTDVNDKQAMPLMDYRRPGYRSYVLILLTVVYAFNFIDRQILVILQEPIKADLGLSDSQLGLMTGFAFAVFYVVCGIPIARWAERSSRSNIIAIALALWSGMTALSGSVQSFGQMLLARIGVGVGESGGSPPSHSIISDIYPPEKRASALSIYSTGVNLGILAGFLLGGWIGEYFGWRIAFVVVGLPGILLAILVKFTLKEPKRGLSESADTNKAKSNDEAPSIRDAAKFLFSRRSFVHLAIATGLQAFSGYGVGNWLPSFFIRLHDMSVGEVGTWMALIGGGVGFCGALLGGFICDRLSQRDRRWLLWVPAIAGLLSMPMTLMVFWTENATVAMLLYVLPTLLYYMYLGPCIAAAHSLVGLRMRALTSAILFLVLNLIGLGLGPLAIGVTSDLLSASMGADSLRYALTIFSAIIPVWAFFHYMKAASYLRADIQRLNA